MSRRAFAAALVAIVIVGLGLRTAWLRADPAVQGSVGVVWHDEGAWVHNARNRALWGHWLVDRDAWNPVFLTPVFTALEYVAFRAVGVGLWQARVVPVASGIVAVLALMAGLREVGGRKAAVIGGALLATNYVFVMWNRAALMESTMTSFIVVAWAAYAGAGRRPAWGLVAGTSAVLAWFTKASAAFFVAALAVEAITSIVLSARARTQEQTAGSDRRGAWVTLAALAVTAAALGLFFVWPHWTDYEFYNWQMSVTRKPEYTLSAFLVRASWLPVVQGLFTRMWIVLAAGCAGALIIAARWRNSRPGERLLGLWLLVGLAELVVHDSGNERRYVMFVPALVALAAVVFAAGRPLLARAPGPVRRQPAAARLLVALLVACAAYLVIGSLLRPLFHDEVAAGHLHAIVRLSALAAIAAGTLAAWRWAQLRRALSTAALPAALTIAAVASSLVWDLTEYAMWARTRAQMNYEASVAVGRLLASGTLVQGKLANGLDLENRIRPLFVGNGFGNYADRLTRDDARYILTYELPRIGYESSDGSGLIQGILDAYPDHAAIATFAVDETPGPDRAVLFDKFPHGQPPHASH